MLNHSLKFLAVAALCATSFGAEAQWGGRLKIGNVAAGATGQFSTIVADSETRQPTSFAGVTSLPEDQYTTNSAGVVGSFQMHPVTWAGFQVNYGFTHYQERFRIALQGPGVAQQQIVRVPTDMHEATAGYLIHPKHIPFQPYMAVGGGAIDFNPRGGAVASSPTTGTHQWRGTGYLETGFDLPTHSKHIGFRVASRTLVYRSPDFATSAIAYSSWRITTEPMVAAVYKF